jgi:ABC-2 type transport system permease protein
MNLRSTWTLFRKEVWRFAKVWLQTVFSPLVTTALYFLVFGVALGSRLGSIGWTTASGDTFTVGYDHFVVPGLMMLTMISNSFLNTSSSLFQSKINGTLGDLLVAPMGAREWLVAYVGAAVLRGLLVGSLVWLVAGAFVGWRMAHPLWVLYFGVTVTVSFACLGLVAAMWAHKFDQLSIFPNFVVQPLTFLGGVFYVVTDLPPLWETISRCNPVLYTVAGLRFGLLGSAEIPVAVSAAICGVAMVVGLTVAGVALERGWRLRG